VGSLLQLILLFFILRKAWYLIVNLKYAYRGLNHGTKAIIAIVIVLLLLFVFLNQGKVVSSIIKTYGETNFSKFNPIRDLGNFILFDSNKNESLHKTTPLSYKDSLVSKCESSYNTCRDISIQKYDISISLIKAEKFTNKAEAEEFYNIWKGPLQFRLETEIIGWGHNKKIEDSFPVVLFALKTKGPEGQLPVVLVCDNSGNLIKHSRSQLLCG